MKGSFPIGTMMYRGLGSRSNKTITIERLITFLLAFLDFLGKPNSTCDRVVCSIKHSAPFSVAEAVDIQLIQVTTV